MANNPTVPAQLSRAACCESPPLELPPWESTGVPGLSPAIVGPPRAATNGPLHNNPS